MGCYGSSPVTEFALQDPQLIIQFFANLKAFYTKMSKQKKPVGNSDNDQQRK